jgi:hypothetical protein
MDRARVSQGREQWALSIQDDDITTQGPSTPQSTALAVFCFGRDDRVGEVEKAPLKAKSGLKVHSHQSFFQFMAFLSRGLVAGISSKLRIRWGK